MNIYDSEFVFLTFVCVCLFADSSLQHILCCICCFVCPRLVCLLLPVSLDCPFLIASSVFSNVYLPVSLECPFLIASSVFSKGQSRMDIPEKLANKR
jgi:hypothetical protein